MFEYRFYEAAYGRVAEEAARMHEVAYAAREPDGKSLFDRHGIPRPLGAWTSVAGAGVPLFGYILEWPSLRQRDITFPSFWADPEWAAVRDRSDDGEPMVTSIENWLMSPSRAWDRHAVAPPGPIGGLHQMRIHHTLPGYAPEVTDYLIEIELAQLRVLGAVVLGVFDVLIGPYLPAIVSFLAWPDFARYAAAEARFDREPRMLRRREEWKRDYGQLLIRETEHVLLRPTGYGMPLGNFASAP